jgi:hypothetical protein
VVQSGLIECPFHVQHAYKITLDAQLWRRSSLPLHSLCLQAVICQLIPSRGMDASGSEGVFKALPCKGAVSRSCRNYLSHAMDRHAMRLVLCFWKTMLHSEKGCAAAFLLTSGCMVACRAHPGPSDRPDGRQELPGLLQHPVGRPVLPPGWAQTTAAGM